MLLCWLIVPLRLVCPSGQIRYGDQCYTTAAATDLSILASLDACADKMSTLWSPETSNEIAFITQTFPSDGSLYHLGIEQYVYGKGVIYSDNSFGVGVPFYTSKSFHNFFFFTFSECADTVQLKNGRFSEKVLGSFFQLLDSNPGRLGTKCERYRCAMPSHLHNY